MRLQASASIRSLELRPEDGESYLSHRFDLEREARLVILFLSPALFQNPVFAEAELPSLLAGRSAGETELLPVWISEPGSRRDQVGLLAEIETLQPFTYFGHGLAALPGVQHEELALDQLTAKVASKLERKLQPAEQNQFLERLFHEYFDWLCKFFRKRSRDPELCFDLAQETFLKVKSSIDEFRGEANPKRWITIVANSVWSNYNRDHFHTQKRKAQVDSLEARSDDELFEPERPLWGNIQPSPEESVLEGERRERLHDRIEDLPPRMKAVVQLSLDGLSNEEIADRLGITNQTARSQLSQARQRLGAGGDA